MGSYAPWAKCFNIYGYILFSTSLCTQRDMKLSDGEIFIPMLDSNSQVTYREFLKLFVQCQTFLLVDLQIVLLLFSGK